MRKASQQFLYGRQDNCYHPGLGSPEIISDALRPDSYNCTGMTATMTNGKYWIVWRLCRAPKLLDTDIYSETYKYRLVAKDNGNKTNSATLETPCQREAACNVCSGILRQGGMRTFSVDARLRKMAYRLYYQFIGKMKVTTGSYTRLTKKP